MLLHFGCQKAQHRNRISLSTHVKQPNNYTKHIIILIMS